MLPRNHLRDAVFIVYLLWLSHIVAKVIDGSFKPNPISTTIYGTCESNGYTNCGDYCIDSSIGDVCCDQNNGSFCSNGSFCLVDGWCCWDGWDPETCAMNFGVTLPPGFSTNTVAPLAPVTSSPVSDSSTLAHSSPSSYSSTPTTTIISYSSKPTYTAAPYSSKPKHSSKVSSEYIPGSSTVTGMSAAPTNGTSSNATAVPPVFTGAAAAKLQAVGGQGIVLAAAIAVVAFF